ncbi:hypothetical protein SDC9_158828 [bioreactor metagenome]
MVRFGDSVYVLTEIDSYSGVKLGLTYRVIDVATGELRTTGKSKHCFLNEEGRPVSLKKVQPHVHASFETYREHVFSV